ncbi:MAG: sigma-70 family RNA polymerase sigma factor [Planctomycetes bacterium]|nr:sigma-70 family RNA polymerase sigma factor [Planctomycetota bacterium]
MDLPSPIEPEALLAETGMVRRLAQALVRRRDLAHDVAQDVMLVALRQPHPPEHLRGWLAAVTRRLAGKARRAQHVRARHEGDAAPPPANEAEQHTSERLQLHRRLTDAVLALPEPYRTTVTLRFFDELPPRAIAQRLGVSSEVVRKRLSRGLEMLRERLDGDFGDRAQWVRAFAVVGLLPVGSPWLLLTVLAMNKLALATAAVLAVGVYWFWPRTDVPPAAVTAVAAAAMTPVASDAAVDVDAAPAPRQVRMGAPTFPLPEPDCSVLVVDERGKAIDRATVHCWTIGAAVVLEQPTDATGRCTFAAMSGAGGVLVVAEGRYPHHAALPRCGGQHRIVMPDGESCGGRLLVDGREGEGWRLWLNCGEFADVLPSALRRQLGWRATSVRCDGRGYFQFVGLPKGWRGSIALPQPLWLLPESGGTREGHDGLAVRAGVRDLRVATTLLPHVTVRVVWADDGTPVANADATFYGRFDDDTDSVGVAVAGDRDGVCICGFCPGTDSAYPRWCTPANRAALVRVEANVSANGSDGTVEQTWNRRELAHDDEFLVRLPRARRLHFLAVDIAGQPVAGARVQTQGLSEPTGRDGRGTFAAKDGTEVLIGAPGHRISFCQAMRYAAGSEQDPLVYELLDDNSLTLRFVGLDKAPARVRGSMHSDLSFFAGNRVATDIDRVLTGVSVGGSGQPETSGDLRRWRNYKCSLDLDVGGTITLHSLEPGQRCEVVGYDAGLTEVARQEVVTPAFGEHTEVVVRVQGVSFRLHGRIRDRADRPIVGAVLRLAHGLKASTDSRGEYEMRGFTRDATDITVRANGYVAQQLSNMALVRDIGLNLKLDDASPVTVRVLDERGSSLPIQAKLDGGGLHDVFDVLGNGCVRWPNLPADLVTFTCRLGGRTFSVRHDTRMPEAVLRVPVPARLSVVMTGGWPEPSREGVGVRAVARPAGSANEVAAEFYADDIVAKLLLPGAYRVDLVEFWRSERDGTPTERSLGRAAEITLRAGEHTTAALR